ncbi:MAG TPA: S8 family serine peptidase [Kofleriaceae bacterium]|nr:S8 family serine peptidase [Kofleriaceae bacterium]
MIAEEEIQVAPRLPWRPEETRRACRGRVVVRLREEREHVPHTGDVTAGAQAAAMRLDVDRVDQVLARRTHATRVTRTFHAASNVKNVGRRHEGYSELETALGLSRTFRVDVDPDTSVVELVGALSELDAVESASPVYLSDCPFSAGAYGRSAATATAMSEPCLADWGHETCRVRAALELEPGDATVIVAIIDSGVFLDHVELRGRCRAGADLVDLPEHDVSRGIKLLGDHSRRDRAPIDEQGHGTGCAGIIAARGISLRPGVAGLSPVLPMRALAAAKVADRVKPTALGTLSDIDLAVKLAVDLGARVLNLSFGTPESALREGDPTPHVEVIEYALAHGCILIAASGNSGDRVRYLPACLPGVIAVGAIGVDGKPAPFTTRGDHVALSAPGMEIRTAGLDGLVAQNGTSFAAPFVTGAAALLVAHAARRLTPLSPFAMRDILVRSATPFQSGAGTEGCGVGVLDIPAALRAAESWSHVFDDEVGETSDLGRGADRPQPI